MVTSVYCGNKRVPRRKRRGTAAQCLNNNQLRYYGLYQAPTRVFHDALKPKRLRKVGGILPGSNPRTWAPRNYIPTTINDPMLMINPNDIRKVSIHPVYQSRYFPTRNQPKIFL
jgi:hypothetical protein